MNKQQIKREEIKDRLNLAKKFYRAALSWRNKTQYRRMVIDLAYNGAELSTKGLILLKADHLPSRHGGIVRRFSELYIKTEILERGVGKNLHRSLDLRNKARYVSNFKITKENVEIVLETAKILSEYLSKQLK